MWPCGLERRVDLSSTHSQSVACGGHQFRKANAGVLACCCWSSGTSMKAALISSGIDRGRPLSALTNTQSITPLVTTVLSALILVDERNQLARSLFVGAVRIAEFSGQHSLFEPNPIEDYWDQDEHDQQTNQAGGNHRHTND